MDLAEVGGGEVPFTSNATIIWVIRHRRGTVVAVPGMKRLQIQRVRIFPDRGLVRDGDNGS